MRYLIVTYYHKANGKVDESATVSKRIRKSELQTANLILDFEKLSVVKCNMGNIQIEKDFHKIVQYYMQFYESIITRLFKENGYEVEFTKNQTQVQPAEANPS